MSIEESVGEFPHVQTIFPGLYRGLVKQNDDRPTSQGGKAEDTFGPLGRLRVLVPTVHGPDVQDDDLPWAWPCFPWGGIMEDGISQGMVAIPDVGAQVFVMFEQGDPQSPVWVGTCYGAPERNSNQTELPRSIRTKDSRTSTEYPEMRVIQGKGAENTSQSMMIRFVGDKRIDIYLDEDNYIELDSAGGGGQDAQIRVHSKDYKVKVDSDVEVTLEAPSIKVTSQTDSEAGLVEITGDNVKITGNTAVRVYSGNIYASGGVSGAFYHPPRGGHPLGS